MLVEYFIDRCEKKAGKKIRNISKRTLELFRAHDWPGNIRELQNVIERALVLCDVETFSVEPKWLKRELPHVPGQAVRLVRRIAEQEKELIETALVERRGKVSGPAGAASKLGVPRQTLESKIRNLGINKHSFKA